MSDSRWSDWESLTQQQQSYLLLAGYPEEELKNADSDFLDALLLDMPSRAGDMPGFVSAPHSSISQSQRCFVVSNPDVESSNEAFVYVHGVMDGLQTQVTSRALSNGSNMWLGKLELGVPAIVDRIDARTGKAFARMQGHYKDCSCSFDSKDLIDFNFDEIYSGREVYVVPPIDVEIQLAADVCVAVFCVTLFPKCWVSGMLTKESIPSGCIALPLWLRRTFFLADDLLGHRLTVTDVQVHELPVASSVTLRCVAKEPPTLPDFQGCASSTAALSRPDVILQKQIQHRSFKALTVGLRFSIFYCSKDGGGCWEFEVTSIKARQNLCLSSQSDDEMLLPPRQSQSLGSNHRGSVLLPEGSAGCVFSNCENTGELDVEYNLQTDASSTLVTPQPQLDEMNPGDAFDLQRRLPNLDFTTEPEPGGSSRLFDPRMLEEFQKHFHKTPDAVAFAPGRLEFLGNHLDYNGGPVHGVAINKGVTACVAFQETPQISLRTSQTAHPISDGVQPPPGVFVLFDDLHKQADKESRRIPAWALYAVGVLHVMRSQGMTTPRGCVLYLDSTLDMGAGLSSSAAVEIAVATALAKLYDWHDYNLSRVTTQEEQFKVRMNLARLCQKVENEFVGVPCGILDQACSAFGEEGRIVRLLCGVSPVAVSRCVVGNGGDANLKINMWVFASGARHQLSDSPYKTRSDECKAAAVALGVNSLSECSLNHLEDSRRAMTEAEYMRAKHVIEETHRVHVCVQFLRRGNLAAVGQCLTASHQSSKLLVRLGSPSSPVIYCEFHTHFQNSCEELDFLVDELCKSAKVFGARLTGGGWGGSCFALTDNSFTENDAQLVSDAYDNKFPHHCKFFNVSAAQGACILQV